MKYWTLGPEAPCTLGEHTVFDRGVVPHSPKKLHVIFEGWLGDHLLSCSPCFLISEELGSSLKDAGLTGFQLANFESSLAPHFATKTKEMPRFFWLKVCGQSEREDLGVSKDSHLVVSDSALAMIRAFPLAHCSIDDAAKPLSFEERKQRIFQETLRELKLKTKHKP